MPSHGTTSQPARVLTRPRLVASLAVVAALALGTQLPALTADRGASDAPREAPAADRAPTPPTARPSTVDLVAPMRLPQLPAAAARGDEAGATAFVRYWFDTLNYSLAHADTDALAGVTGAGCQQCTGWLIGIARWDADGATLEGGLTSPLELSIGPFTPDQPVQFAATYLTTPATLTGADGSPEDYPGGLTRGGATVQWSNGRWQMTDVVVDVATPNSLGAP